MTFRDEADFVAGAPDSPEIRHLWALTKKAASLNILCALEKVGIPKYGYGMVIIHPQVKLVQISEPSLSKLAEIAIGDVRFMRRAYMLPQIDIHLFLCGHCHTDASLFKGRQPALTCYKPKNQVAIGLCRRCYSPCDSCHNDLTPYESLSEAQLGTKDLLCTTCIRRTFLHLTPPPKLDRTSLRHLRTKIAAIDVAVLG